MGRYIRFAAVTLLVAVPVVSAGSAVDAGHGVEGRVCMVADPGGFDDVGFNAGALDGLERAGAKLHVETDAVAAEDAAELPDLIAAFVDSGDCDLIVGVGFVVGFEMEPFVAANPGQLFTVIDTILLGAYPNASEVVFQPHQAAFLAGYVAAGISETGAVGVYGGAPIPVITEWMDGYALGVEYYNDTNATAVDVLGWDPDTQTGLVLDFEFGNPALGWSTAHDLFDAGADTVFPVAGATGLGSLTATAVRKASGDPVRYIGADYDASQAFGDPERVILTSVVKNTDIAVFNAVETLVAGAWTAGIVEEDLASGGGDIARFHKTNDQVPGFVKNDLKDIRAGIIDGTIPTLP